MPPTTVTFPGASPLTTPSVTILGQTADHVDLRVSQDFRLYYSAQSGCPGEPVAIEPEEIEGLAFRLRGDSAVGAIGEAIETWNDLGPSALHQTQSVAAKRATLVTSAFHGQPALRFLASAQQHYVNSASQITSAKSAGTWVVAFKGNITGTQTLVGPYNHILGLTNDNGGIYFTHHGGAGEYGSVAHPSVGAGQLVIATYDASEADNAHRLKIRINKVDRMLVFSGIGISTTPWTASPLLKIGNHWTASAYLNTDLLEVIFYPRVLTAEEIEGLEEYFRVRYFSLGTGNVHCVGDSLTKGYPNNTSNGLDPATLLGALLGSNWAVQGHGQTAYSIALMEAAAESVTTPDRNEWRDLSNGGLGDIVIHQGGTNNLHPLGVLPYGNQEATTALAEMVTSVVKRHARGFKVIVCTVPPIGMVGLTQAQHDTWEARRTAYNSAVRNGDTGADGIADLAADSRLSDPANSTYFYSGDTVHLTAAGNEVFAEVVKAAIEALTE